MRFRSLRVVKVCILCTCTTLPSLFARRHAMAGASILILVIARMGYLSNDITIHHHHYMKLPYYEDFCGQFKPGERLNSVKYPGNR